MKASRMATAITAAAACAAIGLIVASCSNSPGSPVAPGASSNLAAHTEITPEPSPEPSPTPTPEGIPCSPGYWKVRAGANSCVGSKKVNTWYGVSFGLCDGAGQPSCASLETALCAGGPTSQEAAAYLNGLTGCTE